MSSPFFRRRRLAATRSGAAPLQALALALTLSTLAMPVEAVEEPDYQVVRELPGVEVRQYAGYAVAEVVVPLQRGFADTFVHRMLQFGIRVCAMRQAPVAQDSRVVDSDTKGTSARPVRRAATTVVRWWFQRVDLSQGLAKGPCGIIGTNAPIDVVEM